MVKKVKVWCEIPDGYELACDHDKIPVPGELAVMFRMESEDLEPIVETVPAGMAYRDRLLRYGKCVIVRPVWKWPEWLTARYAFCNSAGEWFSTNNRPTLLTYQTPLKNRDVWMYTGVCASLANTTFAPPKCDGWRLSLRENPNWKSTAVCVSGLGSGLNSYKA